jgi:carbon monoxide dehydrogenase subunit G
MRAGRWFPLDACDEAFFTSAPHVYRFPMDLPVAPERVWESLISPDSVADWTPLLRSIEWTSDLGLGATRTVVLPLHAVTLREYFFRWEEGRRLSFHGVEANRPLLRRFAEDYLVEPRDGGARLTWTFALEGNRASAPLLKALNPANGLVFRRMAYGAKSYFAPYAVSKTS